MEAAWAYRHRPSVGTKLRKRQAHVSEEVKEISWKAQQRLHQRYKKLLAKGKNKGVVMTAVGRELLGFIWAIGIQVETSAEGAPAAGDLECIVLKSEAQRRQRG